MKRTELVHYSLQPLARVESVKQDPEPHGKPKGLWVSVGEAWPQYLWNEREDDVIRRQLRTCVVANRIALDQTANLLTISDGDEFDNFNEAFGRPWSTSTASGSKVVDWWEVAQRYQGVVISPHMPDKAADPKGRWKPETVWYWTWVCASGCIWDANAITRIISEPISKWHSNTQVPAY